MRQRIILVAVLGAAALLVVGTSPAAATLPKPKTTKIVPGKSAGGVRIGMTLAQAQAAWGAGGSSEAKDACAGDGSRTSCIWSGRSVRERALLSFDQGTGTIDRITISGGPTSPLARWRTARKWGIGMKVDTLFKAGLMSFPVGLGSPIGSTVAYLDRGIGYFGGRSGRVIAVQVSAAP